MDREELIYELKGIEAIFRILKCLDTDVKGEDIARISEMYEERIQKIIKCIENK